MHLTKHHGLGNDFLVALSTAGAPVRPDPQVARRICDRHTGIGADGLLWGLPPSGPEADLAMVLHNSDGSMAEISGNGIRCLAQAKLRSTGRVDATITIETAAGLRTVVSEVTADPGVLWMSVDMGAVSAGPTIPTMVADELTERFGPHHTTMSVGNPHLVIETADLDAVDIATEGPRLEASFPGGINVHFVQRVGDDHLRLVHWERGAGVTLACGSGASVTAVAASRWGLVGPEVTLDLPGGRALVGVGDHVTLSGPATYVGEVIIP